MGRVSLLRKAMADEPFAVWLVEYCESRGLRTGRQAARFLLDAERKEFNPAVFGTWVRGAQLPDEENQQRLHEATGVPLERIAQLVRETKRERRLLVQAGPTGAILHAPNGQNTVPAVGDIRNLEEGARLRRAVEAGVGVALRMSRGDPTDEVLDYIRRFEADVNASHGARRGGRDEPPAGGDGSGGAPA